MPENIKVLVIDENPVRAEILKDGLAGHTGLQIEWIKDTRNLLERIYGIDPDVILIDLENPHRDVLEQMFQVSREVRRPVAMFVDRADSATIAQSVDAGVSAYIVDGLSKDRIKPILDMTISRFNAFSKLEQELSKAKSALEDRKIVDKAKGILMRQKGIGEEEAYQLLRKTAMGQNTKIVNIAQSVIAAAELFK